MFDIINMIIYLLLFNFIILTPLYNSLNDIVTLIILAMFLISIFLYFTYYEHKRIEKNKEKEIFDILYSVGFGVITIILIFMIEHSSFMFVTTLLASIFNIEQIVLIQNLKLVISILSLGLFYVTKIFIFDKYIVKQ